MIHAKMRRVLDMGLEQAGKKRKVDKLRNGIWEVRVSYNDRIFRVLFFIHGNTLVALHAFEKKSPGTPIRDIETAESRLADWKRRTLPP